MEPTPVSSDVGSGDKNLALKLAAAGAAVIIGLGALYVITRSEPSKKKKSKKKDKKEKEKKKASKKKADSDEEPEEAEEEEDEGGLDWNTEKQKPPPGRRPFDPAAAGIVLEVTSLEEAQAWMASFHSGGDAKTIFASLVPLLADLSKETAAVDENDKEAIMSTDFNRWFLTGFISGLIAKNPALAIPQALMILRRMSQKEEDLTEAPMIIYAALLCSRSKEAMSTAFELWLSSQPETSLKNIKNEKQITTMFEKALNEFSEMTMSYMPLILFGQYYGVRSEPVLKQAMMTLEKFFEALAKSRVPEQLEGFYRGAAYAITRFSAMEPEFRQYMESYKTSNATLKKCLKEALSAEAGAGAGASAGGEEDAEAEAEVEEAPKAKPAPRKKLASSGGAGAAARAAARNGRASPPMKGEDDEQ